MHENYNQRTLANDVAIIVINHVEYNNNIRNINLASGSDQFVGAWAVASGFGITSDHTDISQTLIHVTLQVISNDVCRRTYGSSLLDSALCGATPSGRSVCTSDSGGPLAIGSGVDRVLIGITSFLHASGCTLEHPAGFTRVTSFNSWIRANM